MTTSYEGRLIHLTRLVIWILANFFVVGDKARCRNPDLLSGGVLLSNFC